MFLRALGRRLTDRTNPAFGATRRMMSSVVDRVAASGRVPAASTGWVASVTGMGLVKTVR